MPSGAAAKLTEVSAAQAGAVEYGEELGTSGFPLTGTFTTTVNFPEAFAGEPTVSVALAGIDVNGSAARVKLVAGVANHTGFDLTITTWDNSTVFNVWISWVAFA